MNPAEHGLLSDAHIVNVVRTDGRYVEALSRLRDVEGPAISIVDVEAALAAYERTIVANDSPFDRYYFGHDQSALSAAAIRGLGVFQGSGRCATCHSIGSNDATFTDQQFHQSPLRLPVPTAERLPKLVERVSRLSASGQRDELSALISTDPDIAALGRFVVSLDPADIWKYKTPSLRNVAVTAPYMHDGSVPTLAEVVDLELYARTASGSYPIALSSEDKTDLLALLEALTATISQVTE